MRTVIYFQSSLAASNNIKLDGVYRFAKSANWRVHVVPYAQAACRHDDRAELNPDVKGLLDFWTPDGVIVECGAANGVLGPRNFKSVPVVFLDRNQTGNETCVTSDDAMVAKLAARELLSLNLKTYSYVPWKEPLRWSNERGKIFEKIITMNGRSIHPSPEYKIGGGRDSYGEKIRAWVRTLPRPLGVFAANDNVAAILLECAEREKISVPDEMAVIGVDNDLKICERASPKLTSIQLDNECAGYLAAQLLDEKMAHPRKRVGSAAFGAVCVHHRQTTFMYSRNDDRVALAVALIRRSACDGLSSKDVVAAMGCSRRLAEMRFREVVGHTLLEEIQAVRMERAKQMLCSTAKPVHEIAVECGYASADGLRKIFIRHVGMTPLRFRRCGSNRALRNR